ncbi:MFS transporter [Spirillospora sp. NPDC000708]
MLTTIFNDPRERARAFAILSVTLMAGGACGQMLGGALTEYLGWRWCLYVNLPIAAAVVVGAFTVLPDAPKACRGQAGPSLGDLGLRWNDRIDLRPRRGWFIRLGIHPDHRALGRCGGLVGSLRGGAVESV